MINEPSERRSPTRAYDDTSGVMGKVQSRSLKLTAHTAARYACTRVSPPPALFRVYQRLY